MKKIYGDSVGLESSWVSGPDLVVVEFEEPFDLTPGIVEPACLPTKPGERMSTLRCLLIVQGCIKHSWWIFH